MACLTLLLSGILTFMVVTVYSAMTASVRDIISSHYDVKLRLRLEENIIFGECNINIEVTKETNEIKMISEKLGLLQATLIDNVQLSNRTKSDTHKLLAYMIDYEYNTASLYYDGKNKILPGHYILNIKYSSAISPKGGFQKIFYMENEAIWLSATHFQIEWARRMFPCWYSQSTFNISIEHPKDYTALSNMPKRATNLSNNNLQWTHFDRTPIISPYLVSIAITNFKVNYIHEDDIVNLWCRKQSISSMQFALAIIRNMTIHLQYDVWEYSMQFSKINYIAIPNFQKQNKAVVNLGIIIYDEADIAYNETKDSVERKYNVMQLIAEWFGNLVNPFLWPHSWLSKGFITFFATHILNQIIPNSRIMELFVVQIQHESLHFDVDERMLPIYNNKTVPNEIANDKKGFSILRMVQYAFDLEAFWSGIRTYLFSKDHYQDNFWKSLKTAFDKTVYDKIEQITNNSEENMRSWTMQKGYPMLNISREGEGTIFIWIENLNPNDTRGIPMTFTTQTECNFNTTIPHIWVHAPGKIKPLHHYHIVYNLKVREDGWLIFNIQQTAYYRVNYEDENWQKIAAYLNQENQDYQKIHALNRAQIIDDMFHFLLLGRVKPQTFWTLTKYLSQETDYIVWYPMFKAIEYMSSVFSFPDIEARFIKERLDNMLSGLLWKIWYEEKSTDDDFTKILRQEALQLACTLELPNCLEMAYHQLKIHLLHPEDKLLPWKKKWAYCYGLATADNTTWHQVFKKIRAEVNDKILYFLTCSNHLVEIKNFIFRSYTEDDFNQSYVHPSIIIQYGLRHFLFTITNSMKHDKAFEYLLQNLVTVKPSQVETHAALIILINNIYSIEHLDKVPINKYVNFIKPKYNSTAINKMQQKIEARKVQLRNHRLLFERIKPESGIYRS